MFQSEIYALIDSIAYDTGIQGTANDGMWNILTDASLERKATYSEIKGTNTYKGIRVKINGSYNIPLSSNYAFEFDILDISDVGLASMYDNASHNIRLQANKHYKVIITDKIYYWIEGVEQTPINHNNQSNYQLSLTIGSTANNTMQFKNFVVYPI